MSAGLDLAQACRSTTRGGPASCCGCFARWPSSPATSPKCRLAIGLTCCSACRWSPAVLVTVLDVARAAGCCSGAGSAGSSRHHGSWSRPLASASRSSWPGCIHRWRACWPASCRGHDRHRSAMLYLASASSARRSEHNLYLHSSLLQKTRRHEHTVAAKRGAIRFATIDSTMALGLALTHQCRHPDLAAARITGPARNRERTGRRPTGCSRRCSASRPRAAFAWHAVLRAQLVRHRHARRPIVMEGFLDIRISPAARALLDPRLRHRAGGRRPAWYGSEGANSLLVFSQVILSLHCPSPSCRCCSSRRAQAPRRLRLRSWHGGAAGVGAAVVVVLTVWLLQRFVFG